MLLMLHFHPRKPKCQKTSKGFISFISENSRSSIKMTFVKFSSRNLSKPHQCPEVRKRSFVVVIVVVVVVIVVVIVVVVIVVADNVPGDD